MAPRVRAVKTSFKATQAPSKLGEPSAPFKKPPEVLQPFVEHLSPKHVYITHIDLKPVGFKRKIFLVPVAMNAIVSLLFAWRMYCILPWYWKLLMSGFGHPNETTFPVDTSTWGQIGWEIARRGFTFMLDLVLFIFVWPWPVEFSMGRTHGSPLRWRRLVGFREKEIYVRRSREWDRELGDVVKDAAARNDLLGLVRRATSPMLQHEKTGYLTMNGEWDLDWAAMVQATALVDEKRVALDAFRSVVLVHHAEHGWMSLPPQGTGEQKDDMRRQVFEFRDALAAAGKEDLFFRWIEVVQYESTQPGGFGPERQVDAAKNIRAMFSDEGIDFDEFWQQHVGSGTPTPL
ncbi:hypothetical protein SODALDRAFT_326901 [Sodiomyces alkalinus F11]|uniref:Uncharacterized protein n=1 Tax=Sodiomyces alkalinus (strain CBS 110278 / VKM F-3762 / F11) TaxID=1314773 RepID=A0A3N2Q7M1_SODAK|nr:hypothetical protein SODALDRAFT_326901 [Sodiomyces alkalinus F11]ROT42742.1 hypothetical protein SODALDRAFT_326901 [Sodiomyces alkalinus F11]